MEECLKDINNENEHLKNKLNNVIDYVLDNDNNEMLNRRNTDDNINLTPLKGNKSHKNLLTDTSDKNKHKINIENNTHKVPNTNNSNINEVRTIERDNNIMPNKTIVNNKDNKNARRGGSQKYDRFINNKMISHTNDIDIENHSQNYNQKEFSLELNSKGIAQNFIKAKNYIENH